MSDRFDPSTAFENLRPYLDGGPSPRRGANGTRFPGVRPFSPARWLTLAVGLFATASAVLLWQAFGWRQDHEILGNPWVWGASAVELMVAVVLLARVSRESVPGRSSSLANLVLVAAGAAALHVVVLLATFARSPVYPAAGQEWETGRYCFTFELALAVPCVIFAVWLSRQGLTARPRRVGVVGGLGAGLAADSVWRLICPFTAPLHAFGAHTFGVLSVVGLGLLLAAWWEGSRARAWRHRSPGPA